MVKAGGLTLHHIEARIADLKLAAGLNPNTPLYVRALKELITLHNHQLTEQCEQARAA